MKRVYIDEDGAIFEDSDSDVAMELDDQILKIGKQIEYARGILDNIKPEKGDNKMRKNLVDATKQIKVKFEKDGKVKRQAKVVADIVKASIEITVESPDSVAAIAAVGLHQGLKYSGNFKAGVKAGAATAAVLTGVNTVANIMHNRDAIKNA